jgi:hypothetical protein
VLKLKLIVVPSSPVVASYAFTVRLRRYKSNPSFAASPSVNGSCFIYHAASPGSTPVTALSHASLFLPRICPDDILRKVLAIRFLFVDPPLDIPAPFLPVTPRSGFTALTVLITFVAHRREITVLTVLLTPVALKVATRVMLLVTRVLRVRRLPRAKNKIKR